MMLACVGTYRGSDERGEDLSLRGRQVPAFMALFLCLVLVCSSASASAAEPISGWEGHPDEGLVHQIAREYDVLLVPGKFWRAGEVEALLLGLESLPDEMALSRPRRVERRKQACLFGMGRDSEACPDGSKDGQTFYLYHLTPIHGEGSTRALRWLDEVERQRLFYARAMVHMVMQDVDDRYQWSEARLWKQINGWNRRGVRAFNRDIWGASRYRGARSAREDLLTFAEEYFVRPEDILRQSDQPDARTRYEDFDWNLSLSCQEFTKSRILLGLIQENIQAHYEPLVRAPEPDERGPRTACSQFEAWAKSHEVESIDLLLAAATADRPESLYGHLLLSVRYREGQTVRSRGFDPVYQYGAVTDTNVGKIEYFSKGLFGGFLSLIQPNTFRGTDRLFMQYEQRTLRRYALNLSPQQVRHVMERLWEAERRVIFPYYFLSDNCASMLIDLLAPALDDLDMPRILRLGLMPTEVLDVFASVQNGARGPLLVKRPETHFSSREVAMDAVPRRRAALATLTSAVSSDLSSPLIDLDAHLDDRSPASRAEAYDSLESLLLSDAYRSAIAQDQGAATALIDYLYYSSRVERYFMDVAFYERRIIHASALAEPLQLTAEEQIDIRRKLYEEEDLVKRQEAMLALAAMTDDRLRDGDKREFTPSELERLERIKQTQRAYLSALDTLAKTIESYHPNLDGVSFVGDKVAAFEREQERRDNLSMGPPGKGRFVLGAAAASVASDASALATPSSLSLSLSASVVHERLGEQRRRGFRSDIGSRTLGLDVEGWLQLDDPNAPPLHRQLRVDGTLFQFMTIEQLLGPVQESWRDVFGWGLDLGLDHDGMRDMLFGVRAEGGYVYPIWRDDGVASFFLVGLYLSGRMDWTRLANNDPDLIGLKAFLMGKIHLYGAYANALRFEASTSQFARVDGLDHRWNASARVQTEHVLGEWNQQLLLLRPYLSYDFSTLDYRSVERFSQKRAFQSARAGVMIELPL